MLEVPSLTWGEFKAQFVWKQGEHVTLLGPTGQGKTTLALDLLPLRKYVTVFETKAKDKTITPLIKEEGYHKVEVWPPPAWAHRVILWPSTKKPSYRLEQQREFHHALSDIYTAGGWCVYIDELRYICDTLKLAPYVENLWQQGRSLGISVIGGNQRPRHVPLNAYDQATHLFVWNFNDKQNAKRLSEIIGIDEKEVTEVIRGLRKYYVLYINADTKEMYITNTAT